MLKGSIAAVTILTLLAPPARAQIVIDSTGKGLVIIERDSEGSTVHLGGLDVRTNDRVLNFSDFEKPSAELNNLSPAEGVSGLSVTFTLPRLPGVAEGDAERIAKMTRHLQQLNEAVMRQCEPIAAVFGKPCRLSQSNLRAYFGASFNGDNGGNANARFEIATPRAPGKSPN